MDPVEKAAATIEKFSMLRGGESVLIGLSGGPDSVCLTTVLKKLSSALDLTLNAVYIDHGLRPSETPREAEFCEEFCQGLGIPFRAASIDVKQYAEAHGLNIQEAARQLRYRELDAVAFEARADRVALGHNLDDQAETFLMRILRGSGPGGLAGIPPVRGNIIRPLIETEREDIEEFLAAEGISYVVDSSNLGDKYMRNRVRVSLMPLVKEFNPNILQTLSHTADIFREEERYFDIAVTKTLMRLITNKTDTAIELFLSPLEGMDSVLLRRVLRRAIEETRGLRGIQFVNLEDIIKLVKEGSSGDRIHLPKGIRAIKKYSTLLLTSEPPAVLGAHVLDDEGEVVLRAAGVLIKASVKDYAPSQPVDGRFTVLLDAGKAAFPLAVRARKDGDYFYPMGFGKRKKLQDLFVDEKVPRDERDAVPIVTSNGEVVWVAGYRGDERFGVTDGTRKFLVLEMKPARR